MLRTNMLMTALLATVAMALGAAAGTAASLSFSPGGSITLASLGKVTFEPNLSGFGAVQCEFSLFGSLHAGAISKVEGALIGYITSSTQPGNCTGGSATILNTFPWHETYNSIEGTLPEAVTGATLLLHNVAFLIAGSSSCLYVASNLKGKQPLARIGAGQYRSGLQTLLTEAGAQSYSSITRLSGFLNCPTTPSLKGTFSFTTQTITRT